MAELTKSRPTNLLKNIGVVGTEGYAVAQRSMQQLANTADRIADVAYRHEANKLETEASFDAKHDPIKWQDKFLIEDEDGDFKITEMYEDESEGKLLYKFKSPVSNEMLPVGKIYNTAYNKEREPVFEKSLVLAVNDFARQAESNNILNPNGYMNHVSAYIDEIGNTLDPRYTNLLKDLENDVISRHYNNIVSHVKQLELEQLNYRRKSNLIQSTNTLIDYMGEIGHIHLETEPAFWIERGENNKVIIKYNSEDNISELDGHVKLLNDIIQDVESQLTIPTESKLGWIDNQYKKIAFTLTVNLAKKLKIEGDKFKTDENFTEFVKELKLGTSSNNSFVKQISQLVKNDKAAIGGIYELVNSYHLDLIDLNKINFEQTKLLIKNKMAGEYMELLEHQTTDDPAIFELRLEKFQAKVTALETLFPEFNKTLEGKDLINTLSINSLQNIIFAKDGNRKAFGQLSDDLGAGIIKEFYKEENYNNLDNLIATYKKYTDNGTLDKLMNQDHNQVTRAFLGIYKQLETESTTLNEKMWFINAGLMVDGPFPINNDKAHRDGLSLFFLEKEKKFQEERTQTISNSPLITKSGFDEATTATEERLGKKQPMNDWNMKLQYFSKFGILDSQTYSQLNNGVNMGNEIALSSTRMFMEIKHLRNEWGGHVGSKLLSSIDSKSFMFYELMEEVLQGMPQSQWNTGYEAVQNLIAETKKDNLDNRNRLTMAQKFGDTTDIKKHMIDGIKDWEIDIKIEDIEENINLYNDIMDMYMVNMAMGTFGPKQSMNDALVKTVMQKYAKSSISFDATLGPFKEDERFTLLPPELVYRNANLPLEEWLMPYVNEELVKDINWEGVNLSLIEELEQVTVKRKEAIDYTDPAIADMSVQKVYSINTDPTDPDQKEKLILGKNLFLKVYQAPRGQFPTYKLYYIVTKQSEYANHGQMVELRKKDGTDLIIDFTPRYKEATQNWQTMFYEEQWENWLYIKENKKREFKQKVIDTIESFGTY